MEPNLLPKYFNPSFVFDLSNQKRLFSAHKNEPNITEKVAVLDTKNVNRNLLNTHDYIKILETNLCHGLNNKRHNEQIRFGKIFRRNTKTPISKIKKKAMIYSLMRGSYNRCSGFCFDEISILYARIEDLREELLKYIKVVGVINDDMTLIEKIHLIVNVVKHIGIEIEPHIFRTSFFKMAKNNHDLEIIRINNKKITSTININKSERRSEDLKQTKNEKEIVRGVFGCVNSIYLNNEYIMNIFGKSCLRVLNNNMVFYWNNLLDIKNASIKMLHTDGRYFCSPLGWKQTFELVAIIECKGKFKSASLAFAFLNSAKETNYYEFFLKVKNMKLPKFVNITSDFEIAINNAITSVFPKSKVRGCYFHYRNNIWKMLSKIKKWTGKEISNWVLMLINLLPFIVNTTEAIYLSITQLSNDKTELFKSTDFKMLIYVYSTYVKKLKSMFQIDLGDDLIRTNNACEGRNSILKRKFPVRPSINDLVDFISVRFKQDSIKSFEKPKEKTSFDYFLLDIQVYSKISIKDIILFCKKGLTISNTNANILKNQFDDFKKGIIENTNNFNSLQAMDKLNCIEKEYSKFKKDKKIELDEYKIILKHYMNLKEDTIIDCNDAEIKNVGNDLFTDVFKISENETSFESNEIIDVSVNELVCKIFSDTKELIIKISEFLIDKLMCNGKDYIRLISKNIQKIIIENKTCGFGTNLKIILK